MVKLEIVPKIIAKKLPYEGWVKMWDITCLFITLDQPFLYPQLILVSYSPGGKFVEEVFRKHEWEQKMFCTFCKIVYTNFRSCWAQICSFNRGHSFKKSSEFP